jgi:hypothetical protein
MNNCKLADHHEIMGRYNRPIPAWFLENLSVSDIAPQCVHALVPRLIGHLENRRAPGCGAGQERSNAAADGGRPDSALGYQSWQA